MAVNITKLLFRSQKQLIPITYNRLFTKHLNATRISNLRYFSTPVRNEENPEAEKIVVGNDEKYKIFRDEDAQTIFDVSEEMDRVNLDELDFNEEYIDPYEGLNKTRGKTGVFEIEDLVECLKKEKARNIFVSKVPKEWAYTDYIVFTTAKSVRHMHAIMSFVRKLYKVKKYENDHVPVVEGKMSMDWQALDMGNIALHVFSQETRDKFDLETLWAVGSKYDDITNKKTVNVIDTYNRMLQEFEPAES